MKKILILSLAVNISVVTSGCGQRAEVMPQKIFKNDSDYYIALLQLKEGNQKKAERLFRHSSKKGSLYCARRSSEELTKLGNVQERINACEQLLKKYDDEDARLTAAKVYADASEYAKIIRLTDGIDLSECSNPLAGLRLHAMLEKNDTRCDREAYSWFTSRPLSADHYKFYSSFTEKLNGTEPDVRNIIDFRIEVYRRNYHAAYEQFIQMKDSIPLIPQLVSDMGKACLYGSSSYLNDAQLFDRYAAQLEGKDSQFYAYFYAGRLYDKAGDYSSRAAARFKSAMNAAGSSSNYDNALWYLLNTSLRISSERAVDAVKEYCGTWHNPAYFDDFFEMLSPILLSEGQWNIFYDIYKTADGCASDSVIAKYAYIYGRLVQEGLASPVIGDTHGSEAAAAFTRALTSGNDVYYRVMAVNKLGYGGDRADEILCNSVLNDDFVKDADAEQLLLGYAAFGLPEMIYAEWQELTSSGVRISLECAARLSAFLNACGHNMNDYYPQALRIAARATAFADEPLTKESLSLLYPRNYSQIVQENCTKFGIDEEIMYALIRTESFFDSDIVSSAGAVGLTQLMDFTASDIARKLKYSEYSLKDAEKNIEFGTYYLAELLHRLDGSLLSAFFSYNAGITRVRRWRQSSKIEFGGKTSLPDDLFLETVPYTETRDYGRKLIAAASMYGWIYYDKSVCDIISAIVK